MDRRQVFAACAGLPLLGFLKGRRTPKAVKWIDIVEYPAQDDCGEGTYHSCTIAGFICEIRSWGVKGLGIDAVVYWPDAFEIYQWRTPRYYDKEKQRPWHALRNGAPRPQTLAREWHRCKSVDAAKRQCVEAVRKLSQQAHVISRDALEILGEE